MRVFGGRLEALSRVQGFLARSNDFAVELGEIVRAEIEAHGDGAGVRIKGPVIELPGEKTQPFALAVHELATNAMKYVALSARRGQLDVLCRIERDENDGTQRLVLDWEGDVHVRRSSGAAEEPFSRKGYGRELIERALPYQLGAQSNFELTPGGVRCSIAVPLSALQGKKG